MKTNDNRLDSDAFEDLMHEVGVLDALEKEREQNFLEIMSTIRIRRRKRIFFSISCTAAAAVTLFLILMLPAGKKDMSEIPEVPTLITDSGESFVLEDRDSYTLDLLAVSDTREEPAKVRPEDVPAENEAAQIRQEAQAYSERVHAEADAYWEQVILPERQTTSRPESPAGNAPAGWRG